MFFPGRFAITCSRTASSFPPSLSNFPTAIGLVISFVSCYGAWSHNFWDGFTHRHGWFVSEFVAAQPVVTISSATFQVALVLQEVSTVVGFAHPPVAYGSGCAATRSRELDTFRAETWRYLFWVAITAAAFVVGYLAAVGLRARGVIPWVLFFRIVIFRRCRSTHADGVPLSFNRPRLIIYPSGHAQT